MEYNALRCLLGIFNDVFGQDAMGNDVFTYVNEACDWPDDYSRREYPYGSYRQDLWYCALMRSKPEISHKIAPFTRVARYTSHYTPYHYVALRYLDDWYDDHRNGVNFKREIEQILEIYPLALSEDEKETQRKLEQKRQKSKQRVYGSWIQNESLRQAQ